MQQYRVRPGRYRSFPYLSICRGFVLSSYADHSPQPAVRPSYTKEKNGICLLLLSFHYPLTAYQDRSNDSVRYTYGWVPVNREYSAPIEASSFRSAFAL